MLLSLEITNFGLIEHLELQFKPGLTVLTGETGAGKSIVIEALQVALGGRAYGEYIKSGAEKALVQAIFELKNLPDLEKKLSDFGLECEDGLLILTRQLSRSGRNICRINGQVTTLQQFKQIGSYLLDMHGQHDQQSLLNPSRHMDLLDRFGGDKLLDIKEKVAGLYAMWQSAKRKLDKIRLDFRERARQAEMLRFQVEEIDTASLSENEEEILIAEKTRLANAEKIVQLAQAGYAALYAGENRMPSAVDQLGRAVEYLEKLKELDDSLVPLLETVSSAFYQVQEAARELVSYRDGIEFQPERLEEIERRLSEISRLKAKYGDSITEILAYRNAAAAQLEELDNSEVREKTLEKEVKELEDSYKEMATKLSSLRKDAAQKLKKAVEKELKDLEMQGVTMDVKISPSTPGPHGLEDIEFLISTNTGEPPKPLAKIASGGELSRIMLAFKSILAAVDQIPSLVFDEVDTGIGGKTLQAVARKLEELSQHRQTIVITHAAPIAASADTHYYVYKQSVNGKTITQISLLEEENRIQELARMLGGKEISRPVLEHARQLLRQK